MDSFDQESLSKNINNYKSIIKSKFENFNFSLKELKNNVESLCIAWDYSPRLIDDKKHYGKFLIFRL